MSHQPLLFAFFLALSSLLRFSAAVHISVPCCHDVPQADAQFGPPLPSEFPGIVGEVMFVGDSGCKAAELPQVHGYQKVFVIERGQCSFATKVYNAQRAGAIAVIIHDNVNEPLVWMNAAGETASLVRIPSVFITKQHAEFMRKLEAQVVFLTRKDSLSFDPPYFILSWLFMVTFFFAFVLATGVVVNRLCCCCTRPTYHINSAAHEPSESISYLEFVEAEGEEADDHDKNQAYRAVNNYDDEDEEDDDDDDGTRRVRFSKGDTLNEPFLVSV